MAHAFNPSTQEAEAGGFLVYKVSSRTARAIQRNHVSKKTNQPTKTNKQKKVTNAGEDSEKVEGLHAVSTRGYEAISESGLYVSDNTKVR